MTDTERLRRSCEDLVREHGWCAEFAAGRHVSPCRPELFCARKCDGREPCLRRPVPDGPLNGFWRQ